MDAQFCETSLRAVLTLWCGQKASAWRNSEDKAANPKGVMRPTATCNALLAFADFGTLGTRTSSRPSHLELSSLQPVDATRPARQLFMHNGWLARLLGHSEHNAGPQRLILLSSAMRALEVLRPYDTRLNAEAPRVATTLVREVLKVLHQALPPGKNSLAERWGETPFVSSYLLLYAKLALDSARRIGSVSDASSRRTEEGLARYFEREVDRLLARRGLGARHGFDGPSLAFALRGLQLSRQQSDFADGYVGAALEAVARAQAPDGTWPDGVAALTITGAHTLQQPSVKIGLTLLDTVFRYDMLVTLTPSERSLLEQMLPTFHKLAEYLVATHNPLIPRSNSSGWSSDRVKWPGTAETWITALVSRFLFKLHHAERACRRIEIIERLGGVPAEGSLGPAQRMRNWSTTVLEPDDITRPVEQLTRQILAPIIQQQAGPYQNLNIAPHKNGVSLVLYGPPGSGKTHYVNALARALGWPLVELTPGSFVETGTESIESHASAIFRHLFELERAVVFFDECDELFRDRADQDGGATRNILTFITASMLPKLQKLHDLRRIVFVVATNYLSRMDAAIRRPGRFDAVLLLDRPAMRARRALIQATARRARLNVAANRLERLVVDTNGLTPKEIIDWISSGAVGAAPEGSKSDYIDWCKTSGPEELDASRLSDVDKKQVRARWDALTQRRVRARVGGRRATPGTR